jgi:hypothetical protein
MKAKVSPNFRFLLAEYPLWFARVQRRLSGKSWAW